MTNKIIYWVVTGSLMAWMLMSGVMYIVQYDYVSGAFEDLGYSSVWVYPLAIAKILGVIAIVTKKSNILKQLAYVGFSIDFILAALAHISVNDGNHWGAIGAAVLLIISYIYDRKVFS
ncbi:MAG: DoxX family protein [Cyclobacteriaceae bacterium]